MEKSEVTFKGIAAITELIFDGQNCQMSWNISNAGLIFACLIVYIVIHLPRIFN